MFVDIENISIYFDDILIFANSLQHDGKSIDKSKNQ